MNNQEPKIVVSVDRMTHRRYKSILAGTGSNITEDIRRHIQETIDNDPNYKTKRG